jgi:DDE superfamily endonuclease
LAHDAVVGCQQRWGLRPKRTAVVTLYTEQPVGATVLCVDELGPISPRTFPPSPGWSRDGHRIKAPLEYSRGPDKVWVYGALRVQDGHELTLTARSRNTAGYLRLLNAIDAANPEGELYLITDNLSSHTSQPIQAWLAAHPRVQQVFIPKGACWLNLQEPWWRLFRREALAGQTFADGNEIEQASEVATQQLNRRAKPWVWGRPARTPRHRRRVFVYRL